MTDVSKLYVGNLSSNTESTDIQDAFSSYGRIRSVEMKRRYAFVDFAHKSDAESALNSMNGKEIDGSKLIVEWTKGQARGPGSLSRRNTPRRYGDSRRSAGRRPPERSDYRIAVSNLPDRCHWSELKDYFRQIGPVVFGDVWGTRGVIEFKYKVDMAYAIKEFDGSKWKGYTLTVEKDLRTRRSRSRDRRHRVRERSRRSRSGDSRSRSRSRSGSHNRSRSREGKGRASPERRSWSPKMSPKRSPSRSTERKNSDKNIKNTDLNGDVSEKTTQKNVSRSPSPDHAGKKRKHSRSRSRSNGRETKRRRSLSQGRNSPEHSPQNRNSSSESKPADE